MFEVTANDGLRQQKVKLTKRELSELVTRALWQGAMASCVIENINTAGVEIPNDLQLPDALLTTPDSYFMP